MVEVVEVVANEKRFLETNNGFWKRETVSGNGTVSGNETVSGNGTLS